MGSPRAGRGCRRRNCLQLASTNWARQELHRTSLTKAAMISESNTLPSQRQCPAATMPLSTAHAGPSGTATAEGTRIKVATRPTAC